MLHRLAFITTATCSDFFLSYINFTLRYIFPSDKDFRFLLILFQYQTLSLPLFRILWFILDIYKYGVYMQISTIQKRSFFMSFPPSVQARSTPSEVISDKNKSKENFDFTRLHSFTSCRIQFFAWNFKISYFDAWFIILLQNNKNARRLFAQLINGVW